MTPEQLEMETGDIIGKKNTDKILNFKKVV
jgi:hypothetical protein